MLWAAPLLSTMSARPVAPTSLGHRPTCRGAAPRSVVADALRVSLDTVLATNRWNIRPLLAANSIALVLLAAAPVHAFGPLSSKGDNLNNIPSQLSSTGEKTRGNLGKLLKNKDVQDCARKCVATCIRGGGGAPGRGPISVRKEIIVFKDGFRSRQYCLSECTHVCAASLGIK